ncbi:hypothetical protein MMC12_003231 [Toensbergia leucococca]|nr:hypothetical protein [Toensbergia leucococca]
MDESLDRSLLTRTGTSLSRGWQTGVTPNGRRSIAYLPTSMNDPLLQTTHLRHQLLSGALPKGFEYRKDFDNNVKVIDHNGIKSQEVPIDALFRSHPAHTTVVTESWQERKQKPYREAKAVRFEERIPLAVKEREGWNKQTLKDVDPSEIRESSTTKKLGFRTYMQSRGPTGHTTEKHEKLSTRKREPVTKEVYDVESDIMKTTGLVTKKSHKISGKRGK